MFCACVRLAGAGLNRVGCAEQRYEKVGQSESESDWSRDEKKGEYSQDEGETDVELSQVGSRYCWRGRCARSCLRGAFAGRFRTVFTRHGGSPSETAQRQAGTLLSLGTAGKDEFEQREDSSLGCRAVLCPRG